MRNETVRHQITVSTPGHYDVIIRDVGRFTSVVDEQTPGNGDDTMIINTDHTLYPQDQLGDQNSTADTPRQEERNLMRGIIRLGLAAVASGLIMGAVALASCARPGAQNFLDLVSNTKYACGAQAHGRARAREGKINIGWLRA